MGFISKMNDAVRRLSSAEVVVLGFNLLYLAAGLVGSLTGRNSEFILYVAVLVVLITAIFAFHRRVGLPLAALWGLSIWGMAHMAGGLLPIPANWPQSGDRHVLYNLWLIPGWLKFDQLVHAYGFGLVTWICWLGLRRALDRPGVEIRPTIGLLTICAAAGMGFGALNEVVEFIATLSLPESNVGGYENTGWDLIANLVGCLIAACMIRWRKKP